MERVSEEDSQDEDDLCIVCWENMREVIFYNCMHMVRSRSFHSSTMPPSMGFPCLPNCSEFYAQLRASAAGLP